MAVADWSRTGRSAWAASQSRRRIFWKSSLMLIPTWGSSTGQEEGMEGGMVTPTPALVRFTGIQKTYDGEHLVVKNLDLDIRKVEFVTLLGPSGSSKTTTLMMLAGFAVPTHGAIYLADRP